jgi:hypothetical protein
MPVRPELVEAVRAVINSRRGSFVEAIGATSNAVRADFAKRGIRSPSMGATLMGEDAKLLKQHVQDVLTEVLTLLTDRGELDDPVAEWLKGEAARLVDSLGGALRGVPGALHESGGPWEVAKAALAGDAEMRISGIKSHAKNQITTAQNVANLGPVPRADHGSVEPSLAGVLGAAEEQIVTKLKEVCPSAAGAYEQGVRDLAGPERLSYRGPATEMREALRETLDALAPDDEVKRQDWYEPVEGRDKPTMAQRARYALRAARKSDQATGTTVQAVQVSEELFAGFVRDVYGRSNVSTHTHAGRAEADRMHDLIRVVLSDLLGL